MKSLVGFALTAVMATVVYAEDCFETDECQITTCGGLNSVACEIPNDGGTGKCTCVPPEACSTKTDCYAPEHPELVCDDSARHCYESRCICSVFGGSRRTGGGGGGFPGRR